MEVSINGGTPEWMVYNRTSSIYIYIKMDNLGVPPLLGNSIFETTPSMFFGARQFHVVPVLLWSEMGLSPKQQSTPKSIGLSSFPHWKCHIYIYPGWWFQPLWNIWKSVGMMKFPIDGNIIQMFQTTNQTLIFHYQRVNHHYITINIPINITIKTIPSDHIMIYCWIY